MKTLIFPALLLYGIYRLYNKSVAELHVDVKIFDIGGNQPLAITLHNPNLAAYYISSARLDVGVLIAGDPTHAPVKIARAEVNEPVYLPPNGSVQIIPTILLDAGAGSALADFLLAKKATLAVDGTVNIGALALPVAFTKEVAI